MRSLSLAHTQACVWVAIQQRIFARPAPPRRTQQKRHTKYYLVYDIAQNCVLLFQLTPNGFDWDEEQAICLCMRYMLSYTGSYFMTSDTTGYRRTHSRKMPAASSQRPVGLLHNLKNARITKRHEPGALQC